MARKPISLANLNEYLTLSECPANNWSIYDKRACGTGLNIGFRKETRDEAFIAAIEFWAERARKAENALVQLQAQVKTFVSNFPNQDED